MDGSAPNAVCGPSVLGNTEAHHGDGLGDDGEALGQRVSYHLGVIAPHVIRVSLESLCDAPVGRALRSLELGHRDDVAMHVQELLDSDDDGVAQAVRASLVSGDDVGSTGIAGADTCYLSCSEAMRR